MGYSLKKPALEYRLDHCRRRAVIELHEFIMQKYSYKGLTKLGIIYSQIGGIIGLIIFTGIALAACGARASKVTQVAIPSPTPAATRLPTQTSKETAQGMSSALADRYGFPTQIDPTKRYMFYMHGKIIEDQGLWANQDS
jgi:hypothetical protein